MTIMHTQRHMLTNFVVSTIKWQLWLLFTWYPPTATLRRPQVHRSTYQFKQVCFCAAGMTNAEVLHQVENGYRMPSPPGTPIALYEIMIECWKKDEMERPTFETLQWKLEEFFTLPGSEYTETESVR